MIEETGKAVSEVSRLRKSSTLADRVGSSLPFTSELHATIHRWLVEEAYTLDQQRYESWLDMLTEDIHYVMPVRVTTALGTPFTSSSVDGSLSPLLLSSFSSTCTFEGG